MINTIKHRDFGSLEVIMREGLYQKKKSTKR